MISSRLSCTSNVVNLPLLNLTENLLELKFSYIIYNSSKTVFVFLRWHPESN